MRSLDITTIDRSFDHDVSGILAATMPDLVVIFCEPSQVEDRQIVAHLSRQRDWGLIVVDRDNTTGGTVAALDAGADAVLKHDDEPAVSKATINAVLRRGHREQPDGPAQPEFEVRVGALTVDSDTFEARVGGHLLPLTPTEFKIVSHLAENANHVRNAAQIMASIHDYDCSRSEAQQTIRVYIRRIRLKLAACAERSVEIETHRMLGYRLRALARPPEVVVLAA